MQKNPFYHGGIIHEIKIHRAGSDRAVGDLTDMERNMSGVLMRVKINKPVVWRVRVFLRPQDLRRIVINALKPRTVWYVIKTLNPIANLTALFKKSDSSDKDSDKT